MLQCHTPLLAVACLEVASVITSIKVGPLHLARCAPGGHRRFLDKMLKDGDAVMKTGRDNQKFLAALVEYDDPVEMLYRLVDPKARVPPPITEHNRPGLRYSLTRLLSKLPRSVHGSIP